MGVRNIKKQLIGKEDLELGFGQIIQERNGKNLEITRINASTIPYTSDQSIAEALDKDLTVDTLADLRSISSPANTVWASGYHTKNDGAFGSHIFRLKGVKTTETDNGGTVIIATIGGTDYVYELQYDGVVNVKWFGIKQEVNTTNLTNNATIFKYMLENFENIEAIDFDFSVANFTSTSVKTKVLKLANSKLTLDGGNIDLTLSGNLVIDLLDGGIINGGLRYAILSADVAVGTTVIPVESGHTFRVGDRVTHGIYDLAFPDANRGEPEYNPNYITAISDTTITVQNAIGSWNSKPMFKNWYFTNALFDKGGIIARGNGTIFTVGGRIEDSSAGYWVTLMDSVKLETLNTEFYGQAMDGFWIGNSASAVFNGGKLHKSYGSNKQLFSYYSTENVILNKVYINRGNFDVDVYVQSNTTNTLGKFTFNDCTLDGKNTLLITPEQISSFTGLPITSVFPEIGDALHVMTFPAPTSIYTYGGVEFNDCEFVNYQRSIAGNTYTASYTNAITIKDFIFNNCVSDCAFYYFANSSLITVNNFKITNGEIGSKLNYPNGYAPTLWDKIQYSGTFIYDNNGRTDAFSFTNSKYDKLVIKGGGTVPFGSGHLTTANTIDIYNTFVSGIKDGVRSNYPVVTLYGTAGIDNRAFINVTDYKVDCLYGANSTSWVNIAKIPLNVTTHTMFSTELIPFRLYGTSRSLKGEVFGYIPIDGTEVFATMPTAGYSSLTYPAVKWTTNVVANALTVTDTMVKFRVSGGYLQMNINTSVSDINVVAKTTMLNKQY